LTPNPSQSSIDLLFRYIFADFQVYECKILSGIITRLLFLSSNRFIMKGLALVISRGLNCDKMTNNLGGLALLCNPQNILNPLIFLHELMYL